MEFIPDHSITPFHWSILSLRISCIELIQAVNVFICAHSFQYLCCWLWTFCMHVIPPIHSLDSSKQSRFRHLLLPYLEVQYEKAKLAKRVLFENNQSRNILNSRTVVSFFCVVDEPHALQRHLILPALVVPSLFI